MKRQLTRAEIIEAASRYVVTRAPLPRPAEFAMARRRRTGIVHRVRDGQAWTADGKTRLCADWLCGGRSTDVVLVDGLATSDHICRYCDDPVTGPLTYCCFSAVERLLYIGSCMHWSAREALHRTQTPWWPEVARVNKTGQPDIETARRVEIAAIRAEAPLYNKQQNVKRFTMAGHAYVPLPEAA